MRLWTRCSVTPAARCMTSRGACGLTYCRTPGEQNTIYLYEVYRDEAALEAHLQAPHFLKWRETVKDWFDGDPVVHQCLTVFPSESAWEAVKPRV